MSQLYPTRTTLIRNLSVCTSHLDSFSEAPAVYHSLCTKASKHITRALEEVLEPSNAIATSTEERSAVSPLHIDGEGATELDLPNTEVFDDFDISAWTHDLEYTGAIGGWTDF